MINRSCVVEYPAELVQQDLSEEVKGLATALLVFCWTFYPVTLGWWLVHQREDWLVQRSTTWMLTSAVGGLFTVSWALAQVIVDRDSFPCAVLSFGTIGYALLLVPYVVRLSQFHARANFQSALEATQAAQVNLEDLDRLTLPKAVRVFARAVCTKVSRVRPFLPDSDAERANRATVRATLTNKGSESQERPVTDEDVALEIARNLSQSRLLLAYFFQTRLWGALIVLAFSIWPVFFILFQAFTSETFDCIGCRTETLDDVVLLSTLGLIVVAFAYMLRRASRKLDPLEIVAEHRLVAMIIFLTGFVFLLGTLDFGGHSADGRFSYALPICVLVLLGHFVGCPLQIVKMKRKQREAAAELLKDGDGNVDGAETTLRGVLASPSYKAAFAQHLMSEWAVELLYFKDAVEKFKRAHPTLSTAESRSLALRIYDTYIKVGSAFEINIGYRVRMRLNQASSALAGDAGDVPDLGFFDEAIDETDTVLSSDSFQRFLSSPSYRECRAATSFEHQMPQPHIQ